MNPNGEKNEMNEQNLEQVAGGTVFETALYRCPVCQREKKLTTLCNALPTESKCPCGALMLRVSGTTTSFED